MLIATPNYAANILRFPDQSVGSISICPEESAVYGEQGFDESGRNRWQVLGPAAGEVEIPEGFVVRLEISHVEANNLDWLSELPNSLISDIRTKNVSLGDDGFRRLTRFTSLRHLSVANGGISSEIASDLPRLSNLQYLSLRSNEQLSDDAMAAIAALPHLQSIGLDHTAVTDAGLETLSRSSSLQAIDAGSTQVTDSGIANLASLGNLRTLNLYAGDPEFRGDAPNPSISDVGLAHLKQFPNLEELDVTGAEITGSGLERLAVDCPKLRRLVVSHCALSTDDLRHIGLFKQLEQFQCYGTVFDDSVVKQLGSLTNLRQLVGDLQVSNEGVMALSALPSLEELKLSGKCDDLCMASVAAMPSLRDFTLTHTRITNEGFALLADNAKLEHVQITGNQVTTRCIETLATMPNLRRLGLMAVEPRADGEPIWKSLETLAPSLSDLWLFGCPSLDKADFAKLAQFRDLKTLRIEGGRAITDEDVKHLKQLNELDYLELTSTVITDEGLTELMKRPALRRLRINSLATEKGLEALARASSIRHVTIGSPNLTDEIVQRVHDRHPQMATIRRTEILLRDSPVSRAKDNADKFWRMGTESERVKLNALEGETAPKLAVTDWLNRHQSLDLAELHGRVVLIEFWGTWCGPCRRQMPKVRGLHEKYAEHGLVIVGLHSTKAAEKANEYIAANDISWAIGLDDKKQTSTAYAVPHWPSFYLVDRNGVLRIANPSMDDLEAAVVALLDE